MSKALKDPEQNETKHLQKFLDVSGKCLLEIGCGEGRLTWRYAPASKLTVGLDPDQDSLRVASIDRPSDLTNRIHFANAHAEFIPFKKEIFDIAILAWSL